MLWIHSEVHLVAAEVTGKVYSDNRLKKKTVWIFTKYHSEKRGGAGMHYATPCNRILLLWKNSICFYPKHTMFECWNCVQTMNMSKMVKSNQ